MGTVAEHVGYLNSRGVPRIWQGGGGQEFFFSELEICMSQSDMLRMAKSCALLGGFGGHAPPRENVLKWCNLVRFGVYLDQILSLKNYHFLYKNFKNCNFLYKRINILDTRNIVLVKKFFEIFMIILNKKWLFSCRNTY